MRFITSILVLVASLALAQAACIRSPDDSGSLASVSLSNTPSPSSAPSARGKGHEGHGHHGGGSSPSATPSASGAPMETESYAEPSSSSWTYAANATDGASSAARTATYSASNATDGAAPTATYSASSNTSDPSATASSAAPVNTGLSRVEAAGGSKYYTGASSYYLYSLADDDRASVLDALQSAGMTVIRIFISSIQANNKGSNNAFVQDVEVDNIGTYDDTILEQVDQLMLEASQRGMKLLIAMHDRYALGFWSTDVYCTQLGISAYTTNPPQIADASAFYTSSWAATQFDARLTHIMNHQNAQMGNVAWKDLDSAIWGVEPQNEPMGHMDLVAPNWVCERAQTLAGLIPAGSSILISSGGGIDADSSVQSWAMDCGEIDVVAVHDYNLGSDFLSTIKSANQQTQSQGRISVVGEWGVMGDSKASDAQSIVSELQADGIPWIYWEVTMPGAGANNFEVWTDEPTWQVLVDGAPSNSGSGSKKRAALPEPVPEPSPVSIPVEVREPVPDAHRNRAAALGQSRRRHHTRAALAAGIGHSTH